MRLRNRKSDLAAFNRDLVADTPLRAWALRLADRAVALYDDCPTCGGDGKGPTQHLIDLGVLSLGPGLKAAPCSRCGGEGMLPSEKGESLCDDASGGGWITLRNVMRYLFGEE